MPNTERIDLINGASEAVARAADAQDALTALVAVLRRRYDIVLSSLIVFTDEGTGRFVAAAPDEGTFFAPGTEVSLRLTRGIESLVGRLMLGHPVRSVTGETDLGMLTEVLTVEEVLEAVAVPLRQEEAVLGIITLGARARGTFGDEDLDALQEIAARVEERLLLLAEKA